MECLTVNARSYETIFTGDWHVGAKNHDKPALQKMVNYIKKSGCNVYILGDILESTVHSHKNFDPRTQDPEIQGAGNEYSYVRKIIKDIAPQIMGIITGNHDERSAKNADIDLIELMCRDYEIPYLKNVAYSRLVYQAFGKTCSTTIFLCHGFSAGRQRGSRVNSLEGTSFARSADLFVSGHTHDLFCTSVPKSRMSKTGHYEEYLVYFGNTGTFLRNCVEGNTSYSETKGYNPNKIGYLKATFNPSNRALKMEEVVM